MLKSFLEKKRNGKTFMLFIAVLVVRCIVYSAMVEYRLFPDSESYINFPFRDMLELNFTSGRTPVYPFIIRICLFIFGDKFSLQAVVALQRIVSFIAVIVFYNILKLLLKSKRAIYFLTFLYGTSVSIIGWDGNILTESFALSGTVFFIYYMFKYLNNPSIKSGMISIILLFVLVFLRPSFMLFEGIICIFWIARFIIFKSERMILKPLIMGTFASFILIGSYSYIFAQTHGILTISDPIPRQYIILTLERGYYKNSNDLEFSEFSEKCMKENEYDAWKAWKPVLEHYGNKEGKKLAEAAMFSDVRRYVVDTISIAVTDSAQTFPGYNMYKADNECSQTLLKLANMIENIFSIFKVAHVYALGAAEFLLLLYELIKNKKIDWMHLGLWGFMTGITISSYIATCAVYPRTMICVLPFMYISLAEILNLLFKNDTSTTSI